MATLENNPVINQLRVLLSVAINLKEVFDKEEHTLLEERLRIYVAEFEKLEGIIPEGVIQKTELKRHTAWLKKRIKEGKPELCYSDISGICHNDIMLTEEWYLHYLTESKQGADKFYDWKNIHPVIQKVAQKRFESSHCADAVEAAFKEINTIIKKRYRKVAKIEEDGDSLMRRAFASNVSNNYMPVFKLADNGTESGRSIQQGYMDIFAGSMKGIRNPKAHANLNVHADECWEMIVLASHLMRMWSKYNSL